MTVLCPIANFAVLTGPVGSAFAESHGESAAFTAPDSFLASPLPDRLLHSVIHNDDGTSGGGGHNDEAQFLIAHLREVDRRDIKLIHATTIRLIQIGAPAVTPLINALRDGREDADMRQQAAYVLGKLGDIRAIKPLIEALNDESEFVRLKATRSIGRFMEDPRVIEPLILRALEDTDQSVRWQALMELSQVKTPRAVETFIKALEDKAEDVRLRAISALEDIGNPGAIEPLEKHSRARYLEAYECLRAKKAANKIRKVGQLIKKLGDGRHDVREKAAYDLIRIHSPAVTQLIQALRNEDFMTHHGAVWVLGEIKDTRAVEPLIEFLEKNDSSWYIFRILGDFGDPRAVKPLENFIQNVSTSRTNSVRAEQALEKIREAQKK